MAVGQFARKIDVHRSGDSPVELRIRLISIEYGAPCVLMVAVNVNYVSMLANVDLQLDWMYRSFILPTFWILVPRCVHINR